MKRKLLTAALLAGLLSYSLAPAVQAEPIATQLTADVMDYDIETGDFSASGNVKITREQLTLTSQKGTANSNTMKARVTGDVHAFGVHEGSPLDAKCDVFETDFSAPDGDYAMSGNVNASFGTRILRSDTAHLVGKKFGAEKVTHFEDTAQNVVLSCDTLVGDYDDLGIANATGTGKVHAIQKDEEKTSNLWCEKLVYSRAADTVTATGSSKMHVIQKNASVKETTITSDKLVYSVSGDTVTATGNTRAVQDGRNIVAKTIIYHPDTGKVEAHGTPKITVDLAADKRQKQKSKGSRKRSK